MGGIGSRSRREGGRPNWWGTPKSKTVVGVCCTVLGISIIQQNAFGFGPRSFAPPRRHACPPRRWEALRVAHGVLMAAEGAPAAVAVLMRAATMLCIAVTQ